MGVPEITRGGIPGLLVTGRYRLVESIGQGGMGRVWRAADEMLDRQVAVKEMRIDGMDQEDARTRRERTLREARATARIDHPNVVRVYDVVDEGERLWIVMELVDGRSLDTGPGGGRAAEPARHGTDRTRTGRRAAARCTRGAYCTGTSSPANVLVERRAGRVVLTDFGIAAIQDAEALTMAGMLVGSPDYMAPERVSGRPQGPPSDLWSLGATLCAALGGRSPFFRADDPRHPARRAVRGAGDPVRGGGVAGGADGPAPEGPDGTAGPGGTGGDPRPGGGRETGASAPPGATAGLGMAAGLGMPVGPELPEASEPAELPEPARPVGLGGGRGQLREWWRSPERERGAGPESGPASGLLQDPGPSRVRG